MQDRPVCFHCDKPVETNSEMVFEAPCGHDDCPSAVFHGICLFEWRDHRKAFEKWRETMRERFLAEHNLTEHDEEDGP